MKREKGITLIALVVTIIVMLVLAGISIVALNDENGVINKAQQAKQEALNAQEKELVALQNYENEMKVALGEREEQGITKEIFTKEDFLVDESYVNVTNLDLTVSKYGKVVTVYFHITLVKSLSNGEYTFISNLPKPDSRLCFLARDGALIKYVCV